jgi:signal peptidase I
METKLFLIGIAMAGYTWLTKLFFKNKKLESKKFALFWHGLFCSAAAFIIVLIYLVGMEGRRNTYTDNGISVKGMVIWGLITIAGGIWGIYKNKRKEKKDLEKSLKSDLEWSETIYSAVLLAAVVMFLFVQAFKIPSGSMRKTFIEGDHLFVNKFVYGFQIPFSKNRLFHFSDVKKGDLIVFRFPSYDPAEIHCGGVQYKKDFIKRVIGLPGDTIEIKKRQLYINDKPVESETYAQYTDTNELPGVIRDDTRDEYQQIWEERKLGAKYGALLRDNFGPVTVPDNSYFVMGDNRDHSCDSRFWGPVPKYEIKGKAWFIYWPLSRMGVPH